MLIAIVNIIVQLHIVNNIDYYVISDYLQHVCLLDELVLLLDLGLELLDLVLSAADAVLYCTIL